MSDEGVVAVVGVDIDIARIAARQQRVVSIGQLRAAGLSREAVRHRVAQERLRRLWPGIYLVGPEKPGPLSLAMGAVLACGPTGVLSHLWAAWLWGFAERPPLPIDTTVLGTSRRNRGGIRVHRTTRIEPQDLTRRKNIPVTTPARTCLDLAETLTRDELERAVAEAQVKGLVSEKHLHALIARSPGRRGVANLKAVLDAGPRYTRAKSERIMLALLRQAGLPVPATNAPLLRYNVDFLWREQRLIVEVDGFAVHGTRRAFEDDRRRNAELTAAGNRVMQVTWRQLTSEPIAVAARIAGALATRAP